jgi:capsular polysaccharide biosynthesis protein
LILDFALPQEYTATITILPPQANASMSAIPESEHSGKNGELTGTASTMQPMKNLNDLYVSILKTQSVEDAVIERYGLQSEYRKKYLVDARDSLESHTKIDGSRKDGLIQLSFSDRDPNRAAEVANGYVDQFRRLSQHLDITGPANLNGNREGAFVQIVDPATAPEKRSYPKRGQLALGGCAFGFTFGIMLALLQGGLVRMQRNPAKKDKLDLLRRSIWSDKAKHKTEAKKVDEEEPEAVRSLRHSRPEATGSGI